MSKYFLVFISTLFASMYTHAQSELKFRDEIRAPDNWELVLEYHTPSKVITSKVMELYRLNSYAILKSEHEQFCKCNWTNVAEKLEAPITAAYIPRGFNLSCSEGRILISQLKKFQNAQEDTKLVDELKRLWREYGNSSIEFDAMLYDTRIFMRLSENFDLSNVATTSKTVRNRHLVQEGETLYRLSVKYKVSVEAIQKANNLGNSTSIQSGTYLTIPK